MSSSEPLKIAEFPLTPKSAKRILRDLVENHTARVKFSNTQGKGC